MSSKSRRESIPSPAAAHGAPAPRSRPDPGGKDPKDGEDQLLGEVIHVPKGKSRVKYALMIGLLILLTVIFLVPGAMLGTFGHGGRSDPDLVGYTRPDGSRRALRGSKFYEERRAFENVFDVIPFLKYFLGIEERSLSQETVARLIVLDDVAHASGIRITDAELGAFLASLQVDLSTWRSATRPHGGPRRVEPNLKRVLAIRRYVDLVGQVAQVPDVEAIEERWRTEHVEVAYDYVSLAIDDLVEAARAEAPDDAALEAWFAERPDFEKSRFQRPATYRATFAVFRDSERTPAAELLTAYPDAGGEDPEAAAENYYNQVYFARFQRPAPEEGEEEPEEPRSTYLSLDEVRDTARAEAPVYFAMRAWITALQERLAAGEAVDLDQEAESMGLDVIAVDEPATLTELREREDLGTFAVGPVPQTPPGQIAPRLVADAAGIFAVQVDEMLEPALRPFEEVQDDVLESWARERAGELALERLASLRDDFEAVEPDEEAALDEETRRRASEEAFQAAAQASGLEVERRDWLDKSGPPSDDPDADKPAHRFLVQHREYADLEEGEVPPPALDRQRTRVYLVRLAGKRPVDLSRMTPPVYESYKRSSAMAASSAVRAYLMGPGLDDAYGISIFAERDEPEEGEGESPPAGAGE